MHKKLKAELVSLANSILHMENNEDVIVLHKKAQEIYEKLSVLKFVDSFLVADTITSEVVDNDENNKSEIVEEHEEVKSVVFEKTEESIKIHTTIAEDVELFKRKEETVSKVEVSEISIEDNEVSKEIISEEQLEEIVGSTNTIKNDEKDLPSLQTNIEDELKEAISADVTANLFEKVTKEIPAVETQAPVKKSLNDSLFSNNIQVGLNDRIAFVKYLFDGSQEDFNRVLSQLNSFKSVDEAKHFILDFVKPDYDWSNKEEFEQRLISLVERKFV